MWGDQLWGRKKGVEDTPDLGDGADLENNDLIASFEAFPNREGFPRVSNLYFVQYVVSVLPVLLDALEEGKK
jgi:hypothetical protein